MLALDQWCWEIMVLISGLLGTKEQACTVLIMNLVVLAYMTAMGLEMSSITLIGQQLGKGDLATARAYYNTIRIVTAMIYTCITLTIVIFRRNILGLFS